MRYTDEQVEKYLNLLNPETIDRKNRKKSYVKYVRVIVFFVKSGYNICEECGMSQGHALRFFDQKEYERFHFRPKYTT